MKVVEVDSRRNAGNAYMVNPGESGERTVATTCSFGEKGGRSYCVIYDAGMRILRTPPCS